MKNLTVLDHPLLQVCVTCLRDETTPPATFRRKLAEAAALMVTDATRDLAVRPVTVKTPLARARGAELRHEIILVPVLRAGLAFLDAFLQVLPDARVGFIGIKRDEATAQPHIYSASLPVSLKDTEALVLDPMLATGGSAVAAIELLRARQAKRIRLISLVAAPPGVKAVNEAHPDVRIFTAALDPKLNSRAYIVPGLGDAGDRAFRV